MRALACRGYTLVELLLGLVLLALFAGTMVAVVHSAGATAARASAALRADRTVTSLRLFLQQELRDGVTGDLLVLSPARLAMSRPIGQALTCADSGSAVLIADSAWSGTRSPAGRRDDAWLLVDPAAGTWLRLTIDSVAADRCPDDNAPAMRLDVAAHFGRAVAVRVMEPVELSAYRSGAADWFGLTPADRSAAVQPFAGPLTPATARFSRFAARLVIDVPPLGVAATSVVTPLGP